MALKKFTYVHLHNFGFSLTFLGSPLWLIYPKHDFCFQKNWNITLISSDTFQVISVTVKQAVVLSSALCLFVYVLCGFLGGSFVVKSSIFLHVLIIIIIIIIIWDQKKWVTVPEYPAQQEQRPNELQSARERKFIQFSLAEKSLKQRVSSCHLLLRLSSQGLNTRPA